MWRPPPQLVGDNIPWTGYELSPTEPRLNDFRACSNAGACAYGVMQAMDIG